jgi:pre-rRNA-processing protein TSR1
MSSYQADWYLDESGNFDSEAAAQDDNADDEGIADGIVDVGASNASKKQEQADEIAFPDEMDTPEDVLARVRFARYRALQSFRSSPWHPKENLPPSYSSIFEFEDFGGMQRRILNEMGSVMNMQNTDTLAAQQLKKKKNQTKTPSGSIDTTAFMTVDNEEETDAEMDDELGNLAAAHADDEVAVPMMDGQQPQSSSLGLVNGAADYITAGQYVRIYLDNIENIPEDIVNKVSYFWRSLTLFSLMPHENKLSVLNYNIQRVDNAEDVIKSKDELLFLSGFRTFVGRPVFSEANLNCDKNKMERFLLHNRFSMATVFGPITYMPCPLLVFKNCGTAAAPVYNLVANGALNSVNPDRIILKKVILTGHPIRVKKRFAVVKHLFHEPNVSRSSWIAPLVGKTNMIFLYIFVLQDVRWFKPAELTTKHGLRGHITEPVGTHGLLKAQFNAPITQNDTVMLVLFKRVYPKFPVAGLDVK